MRSKVLKQRVIDLLGTTYQKVPREQIYTLMQQAMIKICDNYNAYQTVGAINIVANKELYPFPDGFINEDAVAIGTHATITDSNIVRHGYINGKKEVIVNSTDTTFTWDDSFVSTYVDLTSATVPAYYFGIKSAYVTDPTMQVNVVIVSMTLSGIVLRSAVDNTTVKFEAFE